MTKLGNLQITRIITLLITIFSLSLPSYAQYSGGTGEPNDPYQIATAEDLIALGDTPEDYDKHFILIADIDLDPNLPGRKVFDRALIAPDMNPNDRDSWFQGTPFTCVFDGNGHKISNLTVEGESYLGLFGQLSSGARISDLGLEAVDVNGIGDYVGGLVGNNEGSIITNYSTGTIKGNSCVGGLVGENGGSISMSYSTSIVSGNGFVGGLVGVNEWEGNITMSYNTGTVSGDRCVGGLAGFNDETVTQCWSSAMVKGGEDASGGLIGTNQGYVSNCYSTGDVSGINMVGGLAGQHQYFISGMGAYSAEGVIAACYSTGAVTGDQKVGGLTGGSEVKLGAPARLPGSFVMPMSFWDMETSGQLSSLGGNGKTTIEMQSAGTFLDTGWDFLGETINGPNDVWKMWDGYDYPRLAWESGPNTPLVFVDVNDPGFYGQMSKYEVTNAQYCDFLNAAMASGDITIDGNDVLGASGSNSGGDYAGQRYYRCDGSGYTGYGATNGGASRIHYNEGVFSVDEGFGNHPVTYVSWYGAMAFANYYGYYLPTEEQWQAVADYDGTYIYGCGQTIDPGIANYRVSEHPDGTTPVGSFGIYGYGTADMAGNVWEWTSSSLDGNRIFRGGSMGSVESDCDVSIRGDGIPYANYWDIGFRVCR